MLAGLGAAGNGLGCRGAATAGVFSTGALEGSGVVTAGVFSTAGLGGQWKAKMDAWRGGNISHRSQLSQQSLSSWWWDCRTASPCIPGDSQ
jgi:hypothetical protein